MSEALLKVTKTRQTDHFHVKLSGIINEEASFGFMAELPVGKVVINTREVQRMNSCGVREWIHGLSKVPPGCELVYEECSGVILDQMNMITNFLGRGKVKSVYIPYLCESCGAKGEALCDLDKNMHPDGLELPELKCGMCGKNMSLADDPEEIFAFLR